jgi:hypothetical protein
LVRFFNGVDFVSTLFLKEWILLVRFFFNGASIQLIPQLRQFILASVMPLFIQQRCKIASFTTCFLRRLWNSEWTTVWEPVPFCFL